jgi:E3 ubiquitin-protein ligase HERC3
MTPPTIDLGAGFTPKAVVAGTGSSNACVVSIDGRAKCWGTTFATPQAGGDLVALAALGYGHKDTISVRNMASIPSVDVGGTIEALASGRLFNCALLDRGDVKCWGRMLPSSNVLGDDPGEMGASLPPVQLNAPAKQISAGLEHACALLTNAELTCWGANHHGQRGIGSAQALSNCPRFDLDRLLDPAGVFEGTCCTTVMGTLGALQIVPRATDYLACKGGATPTRE